MNWVEVVQQLGFPIAVALILLRMIWRGTSWFATTILVPLKDAHVNFLATMGAQQVRLADTSEQHAHTLSKVAEVQDQQARETSFIRQLLERGDKRMDRTDARQDQSDARQDASDKRQDASAQREVPRP